MRNFCRRDIVRLIGITFGLMGTYRVNASVTYGGSASRKDSGWQYLNLKTARYIVLNAVVNGVSVPAVIDTGASRSVISASLAIRLALKSSGFVTATAFTDAISGTLYRVRELKIGFTFLQNFEIASFDLSNVEGSLVQEVPLLVGQDILGGAVLEVNFPKGMGRLAKSPSPIHTGFEHLPVDISSSRLPLIPISFEKLPDTLAILDLGSNVVCTVSEVFAAQHDLTAGRQLSDTLTVGVEGESVSAIFCVPQMRLGSHILIEVPICIVRNWKFETALNVGWPFFAAFNIILNMQKHALFLEADYALLTQPFPKDRSGIGAARESDRIVVRHVATNSPAEKVGLRPGDQIVIINGHRIDELYPAPGERLGFQAAGTSLFLNLADGRSISLVLKDYY